MTRALAILEIAIQCGRPYTYRILCDNTPGSRLRFLRSHEQGGRDSGYASSHCAQCAAIRPISCSDATVRSIPSFLTVVFAEDLS